MIERLCRHWVYGGFLASLMLLVLTPIFAASWPLALLAVFLQPLAQAPGWARSLVPLCSRHT